MRMARRAPCEPCWSLRDVDNALAVYRTDQARAAALDDAAKAEQGALRTTTDLVTLYQALGGGWRAPSIRSACGNRFRRPQRPLSLGGLLFLVDRPFGLLRRGERGDVEVAARDVDGLLPVLPRVWYSVFAATIAEFQAATVASEPDGANFAASSTNAWIRCTYWSLPAWATLITSAWPDDTISSHSRW